MSDSKLTVTIAGVTGKFARLVVKYLLEKPNIHINGTTRNASKLPAILSNNPRITIFETTSEDTDGLRKALKGADVAVCCYLGDHDVMLDEQKRLIDAAIAEGVARYVAGDWTIDYRKLELGDHESKDDMKLIDTYLNEREDKIKAIHVLNGGFMETVFSSFLNLVNAEKDEIYIREGGDKKGDITTYADSAAATAEVIADKNGYGYFRVAGSSLSPVEIAKIYGRVYGVEPKLVDVGTFAEAREQLVQLKKDSPADLRVWAPLNYQIIMWTGQTTFDDVENARFSNIKFETVEDYFRRVKKEDLATEPFKL